MGLISAIQGGVSAKRERQQQAYQFGQQMAYQAQSDALERQAKERELALSRVDMQHNWEGQAATRDSTLAQLAQAQAKSARLAAVGAAFAKSQGRTHVDAGGEAQQRLMGLLGNVNSYKEQVADPGTTGAVFSTPATQARNNAPSVLKKMLNPWTSISPTGAYDLARTASR